MKKWIAGAIRHPGALHSTLDVPEDKKIPTHLLMKASHMKGKTGQRARLALTLRKFH